VDPGSQISASGRLEPGKSLPASSPLDERTPPRPAPSPAEAISSGFSREELAVVRRAYARQRLAILGVDNRGIEAAFAAAPREHFLRPPPWTASSLFGGARPCPAQTRSCSTRTWSSPSIRRAASTTRPALHARLIEALGPKPGEGIVHVGAGAGYYSAILAELVDPAGQVTAVEFDAALAKRAKAFLSGRSNVRVVHDDGGWPEIPADGVYVNFAVARPADRWVERRAAGSSSRSASPARSGRIAAAGTATAARRSGSNGAATPTRRAQSALPILSAPKENSRLIPKR
jgi:protein-L-isoaspartate(D-aspartate) O-methyltransferase